jgi:prepilin peptidase CpaA
MFNMEAVPFLWVSIFLILCSIFDFYSSKIPNRFILSSIVVSLITVLSFVPFDLLPNTILSLCLMFILGFLLFNFKILGGGDIKALCIVSLFLSPEQIPNFLVYSLIWAGAYAFIFYLISGELFKVIFNTITVYKKITKPDYKMPFTFGILLGWFSLFTMGILSW